MDTKTTPKAPAMVEGGSNLAQRVARAIAEAPIDPHDSRHDHELDLPMPDLEESVAAFEAHGHKL